MREQVGVSVDVGVVTGRDAAWFDTLYRSCYQLVLQYACRRVSVTEADDVVAEVFTTAWRRRNEVANMDRAWLLRTASNYLLHAYRDAARRTRLQHKLAGSQTACEVATDHASDDPGLDAAMRRLSATDQELLQLSAWEQLEPAELAAVLGCSAATARVRLHRARRRLAGLLAGQPRSILLRSEAR